MRGSKVKCNAEECWVLRYWTLGKIGSRYSQLLRCLVSTSLVPHEVGPRHLPVAAVITWLRQAKS